MNDNLDYLFWGHAIFWIFLFAYTVNLIFKNKRLAREIEILRSAGNKGGGEKND